MNQLLISQKVYLTPELKRKRVVYKMYFLLSIFTICILFSYYIYGAYQGYQDEALAKEILTSIDVPVQPTPGEDKTTVSEEEAIVVFLDEENNGEIIEILPIPEPEVPLQPISDKYTASNGKIYDIVGIVKIPAINLSYPILAKTTDALLRISVTKFWGPNPNEVGNFCIAGHNYTSTRAFSQADKLKKGDIIEITDLTGRTIKYEIYSHYIVKASDVSPTTQLTGGKKEVTLITCTNGLKDRRIIKAVETQE